MEDVVGISAPLFSPDSSVFAAIGVSLPMSRVKPKRIKELGEIVRSFARELSSSLGSISESQSAKELQS
jgi:DNA-binding IclR family transcriptional regulator